MRIVIRREEYEVYDADKIRIENKGVCPHIVVYSGQYWQRIPVMEKSAHEAVEIIRKALRKRMKCVDLNGKVDCSIPKFVYRSDFM